MERVYYEVGKHMYSVQGTKEVDIMALLSSSEPFRLQQTPVSPVPLLFEMWVDTDEASVESGREIATFDELDYHYHVCQGEDGSYRIAMNALEDQAACVLEASSDFSKVHVHLLGNSKGYATMLNCALMMAYAFAGADKMTLLMHASVVRKDGKGYLCLGVSGTGKSTHTQNWLKYVEGTDLMNDDNPVVRVGSDDVVRVYGSPWSGKTPCYRQVEAPVGAFLQLKQAPYNKICRLGTVEAYASLMPSCSVMKWDRRDYLGTNDTVAKILSLVPVFFLENLPDEAAVRMSYEAMTGEPWRR